MNINIALAKKRINFFNLWHLLAIGFGVGMFPLIPGTIGSLVAVLLWYLLVLLPWSIYFFIVFCSIFLGIYFCHKVSLEIMVHDHSCIIWDEFIGIWISLMGLSVDNSLLVVKGFLLFRLLDILKPWPIGWLDRNIYGGIGIVIDDIATGSIVAGVLYLIKR